MVYSGSTVVYGRGSAVVVATGMDTEMGKIADALSVSEKKKLPLEEDERTFTFPYKTFFIAFPYL